LYGAVTTLDAFALSKNPLPSAVMPVEAAIIDHADLPLGEVGGGGDGVTRKQFGLAAAAQVEGLGGLVSIRGMRWLERSVTSTTTVSTEATGTPRLLLQQLDENGESFAAG
jgi:hypothetical protein